MKVQSQIDFIRQLDDFVDYVFSFYGADDALYQMNANKNDIRSATSDYFKIMTDSFTWGDGDSLDRERVRDLLVRNYGYPSDFNGGSLWVLDQ
tara:strand:- start:641 stop:919 length:279 start_codon:yes stop_codon:yes gene_type:complete